jgi:hypothetical protein
VTVYHSVPTLVLKGVGRVIDFAYSDLTSSVNWAIY